MCYFNNLSEDDKKVVIKMFGPNAESRFNEYYLKRKKEFPTPNDFLETKKLRRTRDVVNTILNVKRKYVYGDIINFSKIILLRKYEIKFTETEKLFQNNFIQDHLKNEIPHIDLDNLESEEFKQMLIDSSGRISEGFEEKESFTKKYTLAIFREEERHDGFILKGVKEDGQSVEAFLNTDDYLIGKFFNINNTINNRYFNCLNSVDKKAALSIFKTGVEFDNYYISHGKKLNFSPKEFLSNSLIESNNTKECSI